MHEMSVVESLVGQVRAHVPGGATVREVCIEVGSLEHLDEAIMQLAWRSSVLETELAGAELDIDRVMMRVRCGVCGAVFEPAEMACLVCPNCGGVRPEVLRGKGVMLQSIEIEDTPAAAAN